MYGYDILCRISKAQKYLTLTTLKNVYFMLIYKTKYGFSHGRAAVLLHSFAIIWVQTQATRQQHLYEPTHYCYSMDQIFHPTAMYFIIQWNNRSRVSPNMSSQMKTVSVQLDTTYPSLTKNRKDDHLLERNQAPLWGQDMEMLSTLLVLCALLTYVHMNGCF